MNRRLGFSIFGVLALTIGLLVAQYAFAPLRAPYSAADDIPPASDTEPTARPEAAPQVPANPGDRQDAVGEVGGDFMYAAAGLRPVIEAVWRNVNESPQAGSRVRMSLASATDATAATPAIGAVPMGVGSAFLGTRGTRVSAPQSIGTPPGSGTSVAVEGPAESTPADTEGAPAETSMGTQPGVPGPDALPSGIPPSTQNTPMVGGSEESVPTSMPSVPEDVPADTAQEMAPEEPLVMGDDVASTPSLPHVTVPEPLPGSLLLVGVLLGVLSRRRGRIST